MAAHHGLTAGHAFDFAVVGTAIEGATIDRARVVVVAVSIVIARGHATVFIDLPVAIIIHGVAANFSGRWVDA